MHVPNDVIYKNQKGLIKHNIMNKKVTFQKSWSLRHELPWDTEALSVTWAPFIGIEWNVHNLL